MTEGSAGAVGIVNATAVTVPSDEVERADLERRALNALYLVVPPEQGAYLQEILESRDWNTMTCLTRIPGNQAAADALAIVYAVREVRYAEARARGKHSW